MQGLTATISVNKRLLTGELSAFKRLAKGKYINRPAQIAVFPDHVEISMHGISRTIVVEADGVYHVHIPIAILESYASTSIQKKLTFEISNGQLKWGSSVLSHLAIKVEDLLTELETSLPLNALDRDYLKLTSLENHQPDEEVAKCIIEAKKRFRYNIKTAVMPLAEYGITTKELEEFVMKKIGA